MTLSATHKLPNRSGYAETYAPLRYFLDNLSVQVEKGQKATDKDYLDFQKTIRANTKSAPRIRHQAMMRKLLSNYPRFSQYFSPAEVEESGIHLEIKVVGQNICDQIAKLNEIHSSKHGSDLFKPTNKTVSALQAIAKPTGGLGMFKDMIEGMYFLFHEGPGNRLGDNTPSSFDDISKPRTLIQHDLDHGKASKVKKKKVDIGEVFERYSGYKSLEAPER